MLRSECQLCFKDDSVEELTANVDSAFQYLQNTYNSLHVRDNLVGRVQQRVQQNACYVNRRILEKYAGLIPIHETIQIKYRIRKK